jgi:hypothetical protein
MITSNGFNIWNMVKNSDGKITAFYYQVNGDNLKADGSYAILRVPVDKQKTLKELHIDEDGTAMNNYIAEAIPE